MYLAGQFCPDEGGPRFRIHIGLQRTTEKYKLHMMYSQLTISALISAWGRLGGPAGLITPTSEPRASMPGV